VSQYRTIKELVIETCKNEEGVFPSYETLTELVKRHFPNSKWQKTHYAWYKSKITTGKISVLGKIVAKRIPHIASQMETLIDESVDARKIPAKTLQNRYRVLRKLGGGGMGEIFEAIDERLRARVAVKRRSISDIRLREAFEHEACLLANLDHPALPVVSDYFFDGNDQFLVMRFVDGPDFSERIRTSHTHFEVPEVLKWADQILDTLEYLHSHSPPIVHRDIKPANMKLGNAGQLILLDFGLAKGALGQMSTLVNDASVLGCTRTYAPLEQILGLRTDARSDLYALAATLYHLLTRVSPIDAAERHYALDHGKDDPLELASRHNSAVGVGLAGILTKALALRSNDRYQSASDLRQALKSVANETANLEQKIAPAGTGDAAGVAEDGDTAVPNRPIPNKQLQMDYWTVLNLRLRGSNNVVRLQQARPYFTLSGPLGDERVQLFASVHITRNTICAGVRILNRADLYRALEDQRETVEKEIAEITKDKELNFDWRLGKKFQTVSEIWLCRYGSDIRDHESREYSLTWHVEKLEGIYRAFYQRVRDFNRFQHSHTPPSPTTSNQHRLVEEFWEGFQKRLQNRRDLSLNKPSLSDNPAAKSSMSKTLNGFRFAVQIHPANGSADVNITVGPIHYLAFAKLHKRRNDIHAQFQKDLEWKLNDGGESWVLIRHEFQLSILGEWDGTYEWLIEHLTLFSKVFLPRIEAVRQNMIPTATRPIRRCRIKFIMGGKVLHTSPEYNSGNSWSKIIAHARSKRGGAPADLPKEAAAVPQIFTDSGWADSDDY
jgi:serine/threonine protein kinase